MCGNGYRQEAWDRVVTGRAGGRSENHTRSGESFARVQASRRSNGVDLGSTGANEMMMATEPGKLKAGERKGLHLVSPSSHHTGVGA